MRVCVCVCVCNMCSSITNGTCCHMLRTRVRGLLCLCACFVFLAFDISLYASMCLFSICFVVYCLFVLFNNNNNNNNVCVCVYIYIYIYFSFQPVLHDWCNKGCGMCYPVCGMVHIKEPLLLFGKSSGFCLSLSEWSFTI